MQPTRERTCPELGGTSGGLEELFLGRNQLQLPSSPWSHLSWNSKHVYKNLFSSF